MTHIRETENKKSRLKYFNSKTLQKLLKAQIFFIRTMLGTDRENSACILFHVFKISQEA